MRVGRVVGAAFVALVVVPPVQAFQDSPDAYRVTDLLGDVRAPAAPDAAVPTTGIGAYVDLLSLEIRDDEEHFEWVLRNAAGFSRAADGSQAIFGPGAGSLFRGLDVVHTISFRVPGAVGPGALVRISLPSALAAVAEPSANGAEFVVNPPTVCLGETSSARCFFGPTENVTHEVRDGAVVVTVVKRFLTGPGQARPSGGSAPEGLPPRFSPRTELTDLFVTGEAVPAATGETLPSVKLSDRMPDQDFAGPYALRAASSIPDLAIHWQGATVVERENSRIRVKVQNLAPEDRRFNFSIEDVDGNVPAGWGIAVTPSAVVPGRGTTNLTVRVRSTNVSDSEALQQVRLRATLTDASEDFAVWSADLRAVPPLDAEHATFYAHGEVRWSSLYSGLPVHPIVSPRTTSFLSRRAEVPSGVEEPVPFSLSDYSPGTEVRYEMRFTLPEGIPNRAVLTREEIRFRAEVQTQIPLAGTAVLGIMIDGELMAEAITPFDLEAGGGRIEGGTAPLPEFPGFDPQRGPVTATLSLVVPEPMASLSAAATFGAHADAKLLPGVSWIEVPLVRDRSRDDLTPTVELSIIPQEPLHAFVNPGETQVYEMECRNDDAKPVRFGFEIEGGLAGWSHSVIPGSRFALDPGESIRLGIVVDAPLGAGEGDVHRMLVQVADLETGAALGRFQIETTASTGVDLPNDPAAPYDDARQNLDLYGPGTPGFSVLFLVLAFLAGASRRRA